MAARWDRSPVSRKMFMAAAAVCAAAPGSAAQAAAAAAPEKGSGEDGESGRDVARDVAELPARAQSSLGEQATARPRPAPPLKGTLLAQAGRERSCRALSVGP